jgi:hypothetical protein
VSVTLFMHPLEINAAFYSDLYGCVRKEPMEFVGWVRITDGQGVSLRRPSGRSAVVPVMDALLRPPPIEADDYAEFYAMGVREGLHIHHLDFLTSGIDLRVSQSVPYWRGRIAAARTIERIKRKRMTDREFMRTMVDNWPLRWTMAGHPRPGYVTSVQVTA